jgi:hypothetical protein
MPDFGPIFRSKSPKRADISDFYPILDLDESRARNSPRKLPFSSLKPDIKARPRLLILYLGHKPEQFSRLGR